jgi:hypothetical protein
LPRAAVTSNAKCLLIKTKISRTKALLQKFTIIQLFKQKEGWGKKMINLYGTMLQRLESNVSINEITSELKGKYEPNLASV